MTTRPAREHVILVDAHDNEVGTAEKLDAHRSGQLHRAFSIFVFDAAGQLLLQRRAAGKYHSAGLWSNTCCGHPRPGEATAAAAVRRLGEEMGFACALREVGTFTYRAELEHDLTEHELDHVFVGQWDGQPAANPSEVSEWRWIEQAALHRAMTEAPADFTAWFAPALARVGRGSGTERHL